MIKVHDLSKSYRRQIREPGFAGALRYLFKPEYRTIPAVAGVSFDIAQGEMVAYIGPNGAGKSTTIKMLVGILVPTAGTVEVAGRVPHENRQENARHIGVVFGQRTRLWWDIPVSDSFELMRHMYDIPASTYHANLELFRDVLDLGSFIDTPVRQLSLGQRMRADLCVALLHDPEILFLDEPTIGLDVEVKESIRTFIKTLNEQRRTTVILTTHDISDVEKLCDRVLVIDRGRLMFDGSLEQLEEKYAGDELLHVDTVQGIEPAYLETLSARPGVTRAEQDGTRLILSYDRRRVTSADLIAGLVSRYRVLNFSVHGAETEALIRRMYQANTASANATGASKAGTDPQGGHGT